MNEKTNFNYTNLSPFKWFTLENFPFIEVDFDAITEWQLFCKIGKEINKIITSQNLVGKQAEELTNAFNNLQNYVNNYFKNLDVQEEINNKLNKMAQDGTLKNIINQEIFFSINNNIETNKQNIQTLSSVKANQSSLDSLNLIVNEKLDEQTKILSRLQGGTPNVVTSISQMTDTSKIYVLTTNNKWYYYNGSEWTVGGDYQAQINDNIINGLIKQNGVKLYGLGSYNSSVHDFISQNNQGVNVRYSICLYADGRRPFSLGFNNTNGDLFNVRVRKSDGTQLFQKNRCTAIEYTDTNNDIVYIEIWKGTDTWSTVYDESFLNNFKYKYFESLCNTMIPCTATPTVFNSSDEEIESQNGNWSCFRISVPDNSIIHVFGYGANAYPTVAKMNNGVIESIIFNVGQFGEPIDKAFYFEKATDLIVQLYNYSGGKRVDTPTVKINIPYTGFEGKVLSVIGDSYVANNGQPTDYTWHYKISQVLKMKYNNYGINGDGLVGTRAGLTPVKDRLSSIYAKSNYILVIGGENDANINEDIDTFKAGIEDIIKTLYNDFRNAKIGFVTPWGDSYSARTFIKPYADAIKEICNKYGVAVFDSWNNYMPSYNEKQRTLYYQGANDSSHLNFTGHQAFLPRILDWFKSI